MKNCSPENHEPILTSSKENMSDLDINNYSISNIGSVNIEYENKTNSQNHSLGIPDSSSNASGQVIESTNRYIYLWKSITSRRWIYYTR